MATQKIICYFILMWLFTYWVTPSALLFEIIRLVRHVCRLCTNTYVYCRFFWAEYSFKLHLALAVLIGKLPESLLLFERTDVCGQLKMIPIVPGCYLSRQSSPRIRWVCGLNLRARWSWKLRCLWAVRFLCCKGPFLLLTICLFGCLPETTA